MQHVCVVTCKPPNSKRKFGFVRYKTRERYINIVYKKEKVGQ